jgi:hypothetical protein
VNQVANAWGMLGPKFSAVQSGNSDTHIGLTVDHGFDPSGLSDGEKKALAKAITDGKAMLAAKSASMGREVNGWQLSPLLDEYFGDDYLFRAAIGYQAMFVNTPIEAYYQGHLAQNPMTIM